jgi:predicted ATPase/class 3 adenylate cyclase/Tfp pilus assembly protein PilF
LAVADPWTSTFTFLLTDIEGSTRLWESAPGDMARALERHDELIDAIVPTHGGRLVRSRGEGDSAFAVFDAPEAALACAVELQRALTLGPWPAATPLRVRIAVHMGAAQVRADDYYGQGVNRAARIRSIAHGGQILISQDALQAVGTLLPRDVWVQDMGLHRLKDLTRPEHIWQIGHADLRNEFPPLHSLDVRRHNLPVQLTTFVGRDMDVLAVRKRIESTSLVTLTGPGGIGKTRLALQCAAEVAEDMPDGVWFVELAGIREGRDIVAAVADALGIREDPTRDVASAVTEHIATRRMLIVLDNCEHVVEDAARVAHEFLQTGAGLRILATSREPLGVYGESIYRVGALDIPEDDAPFPEEAMASEAVRLFADRAELADREFSFGEAADDVVRICRRLEGIPLAIELAAALVRAATPREISDRLADRLNTLDTGPRTAPERHRTLRAAIEWSYELLTDEEREVFLPLAVFSGGFTTTAAAAVCFDDAQVEDIARIVERITERSLLQRRSTSVGTRYVMLEVVRDFILERAGDDAVRSAEARHTKWSVAFATENAQKLRGPSSGETMATFDDEYDNLRTALARSIDTEPDDASRIIESLFMYWSASGHLRDGVEWCRRGMTAATDPLRRARIGIYCGHLSAALGEPGAIAILESGVAAARALKDPQTVALGLNVLAGSFLQAGRIEEAKAMASEALTLLRVGGNPRNVVQAINILGVIATVEGDEPAAYAFYEDGLAIAREVGMDETISRLLLNLGNLAVGRSDYARARRYYEEAREQALAAGDVFGASAALTNLGVMSKAERDYAGARPILEEALGLKRELGDGRGIAVALQALGDLDRFEHKYASSQRYLNEMLVMSRDLEFSLGLIQGLETIAALYAETGATEMGFRAAAAADAARDATGQRRSPEDDTEFRSVLQSLRSAADDDDAQRWWEEGSKTTLADAVDLALAQSPVTAS